MAKEFASRASGTASSKIKTKFVLSKEFLAGLARALGIVRQLKEMSKFTISVNLNTSVYDAFKASTRQVLTQAAKIKTEGKVEIPRYFKREIQDTGNNETRTVYQQRVQVHNLPTKPEPSQKVVDEGLK